MRVAVVTPYFKEPLDILQQCRNSVATQTYDCLHVMVADGAANNILDTWNVDHIRLPKSHSNIGSSPRLIGAYHAIALGADAVAFLDADNWYRRDHIQLLVDLHRKTNAAFLSSDRLLCSTDGTVMARCPHTDPDRFIDTSCMMFAREAFPILAQWVLMPSYAHLIGDRVILHHVKAVSVRRAHLREATVFYRCRKAGLYRDLGRPVPPDAAPMPNYQEAFAKWVADGHPPLS